MWYVVPPSPPRPYPTWTVPLTSREKRRGGGEEEDRDVGEGVKFGESEGGGHKFNSGGSGDGGISYEEDDEECKDVKDDTDKGYVDSFLVNIVEEYSQRRKGMQWRKGDDSPCSADCSIRNIPVKIRARSMRRACTYRIPIGSSGWWRNY